MTVATDSHHLSQRASNSRSLRQLCALCFQDSLSNEPDEPASSAAGASTALTSSAADQLSPSPDLTHFKNLKTVTLQRVSECCLRAILNVLCVLHTLTFRSCVLRSIYQTSHTVRVGLIYRTQHTATKRQCM